MDDRTWIRDNNTREARRGLKWTYGIAIVNAPMILLCNAMGLYFQSIFLGICALFAMSVFFFCNKAWLAFRPLSRK